jgi:hypothetical protein
MSDWFAFSRMRGDDQPRDWMRWSEFRQAVRAEIPCLSDDDIKKAVRTSRPEKRYGHYRYTNEHMEAVRAYAARLGFLKDTKETANV